MYAIQFVYDSCGVVFVTIFCGGIASVGTGAQCSPNTLQMWLASQGVVLGTAASAECHEYFPLFRNDSGLVAAEKEGGEDRWITGGGGEERKGEK